jgi:hypothetical protein
MNLFSRFLEVTLPTTVKSNSRQNVVLLLPKRYIRLFLFFLAVCTLVVFFLYDPPQTRAGIQTYRNASSPTRYPDIPYPEIQLVSPDKSNNLPPLYEEYRNYEDRVTEWNLKTYGKDSDRYVYFSNQAHAAGWGNIMQEMVFSTLLASGSGRG